MNNKETLSKKLRADRVTLFWLHSVHSSLFTLFWLLNNRNIKNLSSYRLSFFQKLALCRGLDFALPQPVSPMEIQATFEKAYWKLEPKLSEENKKLAAATLRSIALNYIKRKGPTPPKSMLRAIGQLKKRDDIVIRRPDKGSGVVILDKTESWTKQSMSAY